MQTFILLLATFSAAALCLSVFYNFAVRPVLCDGVRFQVFALRDELRRLGVDNKVSPASFNYVYLERMLCRMINKSSAYSWGSFLEFLIRNPNAKSSPDAQRFDAKSGEKLREIHDRAIAAMAKVMDYNSPIFRAFLTSLVAAADLCGKAWGQWLNFKTQLFVEERMGENGFVPA